MAISKAETKRWRDKIELAMAKANEAADAISDILNELDGLGAEIEDQVDNQATELVEADKEVLRLENE